MDWDAKMRRLAERLREAQLRNAPVHKQKDDLWEEMGWAPDFNIRKEREPDWEALAETARKEKAEAKEKEKAKADETRNAAQVAEPVVEGVEARDAVQTPAVVVEGEGVVPQASNPGDKGKGKKKAEEVPVAPLTYELRKRKEKKDEEEEEKMEEEAVVLGERQPWELPSNRPQALVDDTVQDVQEGSGAGIAVVPRAQQVPVSGGVAAPPATTPNLPARGLTGGAKEVKAENEASKLAAALESGIELVNADAAEQFCRKRKRGDDAEMEGMEQEEQARDEEARRERVGTAKRRKWR